MIKSHWFYKQTGRTIEHNIGFTSKEAEKLKKKKKMSLQQKMQNI